MTATAEDLAAELAAFPGQHRFATAEQLTDKTGALTEVLIISTDPPGFMGAFLKLGNPYRFDENAAGNLQEDGDKIMKWLHLMSNIDMNDESNRKKIGIEALADARDAVSGFFMLLLMSRLAKILSPASAKPTADPALKST